MSSKHFVITVERQYGSGGRLTSERLAKELGIHFYDEEILKMTSETSAIGEQYFRLADEKAGNNLLYRIVTNIKPELSEPAQNGHKITSPENLFRFQSSDSHVGPDICGPVQCDQKAGFPWSLHHCGTLRQLCASGSVG